MDLWGRNRPSDHERIRRRDLDQYRAHPQPLSEARARSCRASDADIVVWDPKAEKTISAKTQMSAIDYNVFEGVKVQGLPRTTISRGEVVYEGGQMSAKPGRGKFVAREPFPPAARALAEWKKVTAVEARSRADARGHAEGRRSRAEQPAAARVIDIAGLSLTFETSDGPVQALSEIDLAIERGEFVSLIGPSGCGKTTLLRVIADLETRDGGRITVNGLTPRRGAAQARLWLCVPGARALSLADASPRTSRCRSRSWGIPRRSATKRDRAQPRARQPHRLRASDFPGSYRAACSSAPRSRARSPSIPTSC